MRGGGYSNRTRATKFNPTGIKRRRSNIQKKKMFVPELGKKVSIMVTPKGMRHMRKKGTYKTLKAKKII